MQLLDIIEYPNFAESSLLISESYHEDFKSMSERLAILDYILQPTICKMQATP